MPPAFVALEAVMHAEPSPALAAIKEALGKAGVLITGASRLSNKALTFQLELEARHLLDLRRELAQVAQLVEPGVAKLHELSVALDAHAEVLGSLYVTLLHEAPDQRVEVPKVPG